MNSVVEHKKEEVFRNNILGEKLREALKKKEEEQQLKERLAVKERRKNGS